MALRTLLFSCLSVLAASADAQIAFDGHPYGDKAAKRGMPLAAVVELPAVDAASLIADDQARAAHGIKGAYRFGITHTTDIGPANSGTWTTMPNGDRVWRVVLHCPDAVSINVAFTRFLVPEGGRVFLYNEAGTVRGAFTAASAPGRSILGTAPLPGDRLTVEYVEQAGTTGTAELKIGEVTHGYRAFGRGDAREFGESGPCHVNTICPEGDLWRQQIRSVAHVILGGSVCTGQLLNNCMNDSTPFFLTANHCTEGLSNEASWVFVFNWESPTCDPTANASMNNSVSGCEVLVESGNTDVALLRLDDNPPQTYNAFYSGWDKSGTVPTEGTCIHHPSGDIKKISSTAGVFTEATADLGNGPAQCWRLPAWASGSTEPGSSGGGLWNEAGLLVGQLYGGAAECGNTDPDLFGRFSVSYPLLEPWLGACGNALPGYDPFFVDPVAQDAAITNILGIAPNLCGVDSVHPTVTLKNNGGGDLHSVSIEHAIDGTVIGGTPWIGTLHPLQTATVQLPWIHVPSGQHWLRFATDGPNGEDDDNPLNDADSVQFLVSSPAELVHFTLNLDEYGTETTWELTTQAGFPLYSGGPYQNSPAGYTVSADFCLSHVCYRFTIRDASEDGMCCEFGEGSYSLLNEDELVWIERDGEFEASRTDAFCVYGVGIAEVDGNTMPSIAPNPGTGLFRVTWDGAHPPAQARVMDALGRTVWVRDVPAGLTRMDLDLGDRAAGTYVLLTTVDGFTRAQRVVVQR